MPEDISVGELSRQVAQVLTRFEHLATRLDESYVPKQLYDLYTRGVDKSILTLESVVKTLATKESLGDKASQSDLKAANEKVVELEKRIKSLEDNISWIIKIVLSFVVLGILGAVFVASGLQK